MTAHISVVKPTVGADVNTWGTELNTALDTIVAGVNTAIDVADAGAGGGAGALLQGNNLSDLTNVTTARTNMGLGTAAVASAASFDTSGAAAAAQAAAATDATAKVNAETARAQTAEGLLLVKTANLSDLANATTARTNLGLGNSATRAVGTTAGTVAAGDDSRFGAGGSTKASGIDYDPSTSTGLQEENNLIPEGVPQLAAISGATVQAALDDLNRKTWASDLQMMMLGIDLAQQKIQPQVGAQPLVLPSGDLLFGIRPHGNIANNSGAAITLQPWRIYPVQDITLTANTTITLPAAEVGAVLRVIGRQDATGSRTLAWAGGTFKWPAGTAPTQTATANSLDVYDFICLVAGTWIGVRTIADAR